MTARFHFLPSRLRHTRMPQACILDVSSRGDEPYCQLSPFWAHGGIPVPGMPGVLSDSVEGVWQGLKVLREGIDPSFFQGLGRKRGGRPNGHRWGSETLQYLEARRRIYRPTYEWMLEHRAHPAILGDLLHRSALGIERFLHDFANVGNIDDSSGPLAHAALLADWMNALVEDAVRREPFVRGHREALRPGMACGGLCARAVPVGPLHRGRRVCRREADAIRGRVRRVVA